MLKQARAAILMIIVLTVVTGLIYPLAMTGFAQLAFNDHANGSLIKEGDTIIGSKLIGQSFIDPETGFTLPGYFRSRPSAAGDGYDAGASSGSNLGPSSEVLATRVAGDLEIIRSENNLAADALVPVDLVTTSGSGLDPNISVDAARLQAQRVADQRGLPLDDVMTMIDDNTQGREFGFLGEPRVNVVTLNYALDQEAPMPATPAPAATPGASPEASPAASPMAAARE